MNRTTRTLGYAAIVALTLSCAHVTAFESVPGATWRAATSSVQVPWDGFEEAVDAARDVIVGEFPNWTDGTHFVVSLWGPNDRMVAPDGCADSPTQKYGGCTGRDCSSEWGFACAWIVSVRQIGASRSGPTSAPVFSGPLVEACDDSVDGGCSIFYELADRYVPMRLGDPDAYRHPELAHTDPHNRSRRERMIARYKELRAKH